MDLWNHHPHPPRNHPPIPGTNLPLGPYPLFPALGPGTTHLQDYPPIPRTIYLLPETTHIPWNTHPSLGPPIYSQDHPSLGPPIYSQDHPSPRASNHCQIRSTSSGPLSHPQGPPSHPPPPGPPNHTQRSPTHLWVHPPARDLPTTLKTTHSSLGPPPLPPLITYPQDHALPLRNLTLSMTTIPEPPISPWDHPSLGPFAHPLNNVPIPGITTPGIPTSRTIRLPRTTSLTPPSLSLLYPSLWSASPPSLFLPPLYLLPFSTTLQNFTFTLMPPSLHSHHPPTLHPSPPSPSLKIPTSPTTSQPSPTLSSQP
ncbi:uncharacterized protein [Narcine bancroftii]|uniref:uncharacterized protein n=1 Tax=Narcine bancroftii TaxID=1343680 RepID=UPI003831D732